MASAVLMSFVVAAFVAAVGWNALVSASGGEWLAGWLCGEAE